MVLNSSRADSGWEFVSFSSVRIVLNAVGASLVGGYARPERERLNDLLSTVISILQFGPKSSFFW